MNTVPGIDLNFLKMDNYRMDDKKDPIYRGEFEVVKKLVAALPEGEAAKNATDKILDRNGTSKTGGTGVKHLRENIAESKLSYEVMDDSAQVFLKAKIMDNIHKYFYLILFADYMIEEVHLTQNMPTDPADRLSSGQNSIPAHQLRLSKSFVHFMGDNSWLRDLVEGGKGDLQWERDIPEAALANLKSLVVKDFRGNLGLIIHDIYQTAHYMFSDMPQGDHKKRAKYRFASKTLCRLLPTGLKEEVNGMIAQKKITLDLYDILGQCTWGQSGAM